MAATHVYNGTDLTFTLRAAAAEDHKQEPLIVIDWISHQGVSTVSGALGVLVDDGTNTIYYACSTLAAGEPDTLFINFDGGLPCWKVVASGSDWYTTPTPAVVVDFICEAGDATAGQTFVGYHYERPSARRH
jgi:hypothetical protein